MNRLPRIAAAVLAALALNTPSLAGDLNANASQNPDLVNDTQPGAQAHAAYVVQGLTVAEATATRTWITAMADGSGVLVQAARAANGTARTDYTLWNLATDAALAPELAATLRLAFDFTVTGSTTLPPVSLSTVGVTYDAALYSTGFTTASGGLSGVYGPTAPFPSEGYLFNGDTALLGSFAVGFTLEHAYAVGGLWTMGFGVAASNAGDASGTLALAGIRVREGTLPVGGLAVRLAETGQLIPVTPVPEPAAAALWLAGLGAVAAVARRRLPARVG